ncbi:hypothetical protein RB598_009859 [Gaeumannomyces tritici]
MSEKAQNPADKAGYESREPSHNNNSSSSSSNNPQPNNTTVAVKRSPSPQLPAMESSEHQEPSAPRPGDPGQFLSPLPLSLLFLATSLTGSLVMMLSHPLHRHTVPSKIWTGIAPHIFLQRESRPFYGTCQRGFPRSREDAIAFGTHKTNEMSSFRCAVQPLVAKLYDFFRLKDVYVGSIVLFEIGNLICALAPTSATFIGGRAVAGLGAAGLFTGGLVILTAASPPKVRPMLIGMGMGLTIVGGVVGPLVGGAITEHLGWRWCMWIFLPPGAVSAAVFLLIRVPEQRKKLPARAVLPTLHTSLDLIGFGLFAPSAVMLLLALSWGGGRHAWGTPIIIGLLCGGSLLALVFCAWAWYRNEKALIPPNVIRKTVVYCGCAVAFLQVGAFATLGDYLPLWFQSVLGASPTNSGLMLLPTMITQLLATIFCGLLFNKFGYAPAWAQTGNILSAIGSGLLTTFNPSTSQAEWIGYQILVGIGRGFVIQIPPIVLQNHLPGEELATGTALLVFFQYFGSAVFLCISKTTFLNSLYGALATGSPGVDPQSVVSTGATELASILTPEQYPAVIRAYSDALVTTFWLSAAASITAFFFSFGLGWKKVTLQTKKLMGGEKDSNGPASDTSGTGPAKHGNTGSNSTERVKSGTA